MVTITTHDGRVFTDPSQIKVVRNENTEAFYQMLERFLQRPREQTA